MSVKTEVLKLRNPIVRDGKEIKKITITAPTAGQMRGLNFRDVVQLEIDSLAALLPRCSSPTLTEEEVYSFSFAELADTGAVLGSFLGN